MHNAFPARHSRRHSFQPSYRLVQSLVWLLCLAVLLSACGKATSQGDGKSPRYLVPADATLTPTPFQPIPPTPTFLPEGENPENPSPPEPTEVPFSPPLVFPTSTPWTLGDYPPPSVQPDVPLLPPVEMLPQPAGQVNILLLGSDERPEVGGIRTDTILLLTLNPDLGTVGLTSIPRDLYVYIPGWTVQRINLAWAYGEFEALAMTFAYTLGVHPDHYVLINIESFAQVIDSLGGIDVVVDKDISDGFFYLPAGPTHMDGETALWYARSRLTTSDFDRSLRQQKVLMAVFERALSLDGIARAPEFYQFYHDNVATDLIFNDIAPWVSLAAMVSDTSRIHHYYVGREQVNDYLTPFGAMVLLPDEEKIREVMRQALNSP